MSEEKMENEKALVEQPHSVEISYNAKLQASGKCKCYGVTPEDVLKKTVALSEELYLLIKTKNGI